MSKKTESDTSKKPAEGFEQSLERLEKIVADMESGELSLDDMIVQFEEGSALVKLCGTKLDEVEKRIQILVTGKDGKPALEEFKGPDSE